ncbi:hypothetical protein QBC40DRAFT_286877 [Triangularia verruculosa]|uniref:Uncharacterized protein n=1 Tax=Triangularia verruculosa TaxID=2587418 RepID=A0AAN6X9W5_9PEZI|nr:hypothetical protein QBC40DRAFT_286877 [Triangularia verruculosa]
MSKQYIVGEESPFLKRVLIPFWIIRILIMLIQIAVYALLVAGLGVYKDDLRRIIDEYNTHLTYEAILATSIIIMLIILLCLILDLVSIIKRARRTLGPKFFLITNIFQTLFYVVSFILSMIGARPSSLYAVVNIIILLSFLGLLIYASVVFHQYRKGSLGNGSRGNLGAYQPTSNPAAVPLQNTAYAPQTTGFATDYSQDHQKPTYYDPQAANQAAYAGQGYEPYSGQPQQQVIQQPQQGYEGHGRQAV